MGLKLEWVAFDDGSGAFANAGGLRLIAGKGGRWSVVALGNVDVSDSADNITAAQEAAEAAAARLLAEDAGVRALLGMVGPAPGYVSYFGQYIDTLRSPPGDIPPAWRVWEVARRKPGGGNSPHIRYVNAVSPEQAREFADLGDDARVGVLDASCYFSKANNAERLANRVAELFARVAVLEAALRWIPVADGLPDENVKVLVRTRWGVRSVAHYHRWHATHCSWVWATMGSGAVYTYEAADVTHWRPLGAGPVAASSADSANLAATAGEGES